jgi:SAM-dependent methyltransferase
LITAGGSVLDLACGQGRHSLLLAERGYRVEAVDRDVAALAEISAKNPDIVTRLADLEGGPWPYHGRAFDGIVVTNYLYRPLLPMLLNALDVDGVLIYETFMVGNERFGKPSNPAFLLRPGELLEVMRKRMTVVAFEQGEVDAPRPAVVQRLCATRCMASQLLPWQA